MAAKTLKDLDQRVDSIVEQRIISITAALKQENRLQQENSKEQKRLANDLKKLRKKPNSLSRKQWERILRSNDMDLLKAVLPLAVDNNLKGFRKVTRTRQDAFIVWQNLRHLDKNTRLELFARDSGLADRLLSSSRVRNQIEQSLTKISRGKLDHSTPITEHLLEKSPEFVCAVLKRDGYFYNKPNILTSALSKQSVKVNEAGLKKYQAWVEKSFTNWLANKLIKLPFINRKTFMRSNWIHPVTSKGSLFTVVSYRLQGWFKPTTSRPSSSSFITAELNNESIVNEPTQQFKQHPNTPQVKTNSSLPPTSEAKPNNSLPPTPEAKPNNSLPPTPEAKPNNSLPPTPKAQATNSLPPTPKAQATNSLPPTPEAKPNNSLPPTPEAKPNNSLPPTPEAKPNNSLPPTPKAQANSSLPPTPEAQPNSSLPPTPKAVSSKQSTLSPRPTEASNSTSILRLSQSGFQPRNLSEVFDQFAPQPGKENNQSVNRHGANPELLFALPKQNVLETDNRDNQLTSTPLSPLPTNNLTPIKVGGRN